MKIRSKFLTALLAVFLAATFCHAVADPTDIAQAAPDPGGATGAPLPVDNTHAGNVTVKLHFSHPEAAPLLGSLPGRAAMVTIRLLRQGSSEDVSPRLAFAHAPSANAQIATFRSNVPGGRYVLFAQAFDAHKTLLATVRTSILVPPGGAVRAEVPGPEDRAIMIAPPMATIATGESLPLHAAGRSARGYVRKLTGLRWSSSDNAIAAVDSQGVVCGLASGSVTITASLEGVSGTATLTVAARTLQPTVRP